MGIHTTCRPRPHLYQSCTPVGREQMTTTEINAALTPDVVWDIVTRWGAMQLLLRIYMSPLVKGRFVRGTASGPWTPMSLGWLPTGLWSDGHGDQPRYHGDIGIVSSLPLQQDLLTPSIRGRFYKAVTAIWVMQEACQLLRMTRWETVVQFQQAERELRNRSISTTCHAIQEDVDALEVLDFFGNWCIPRIFASVTKLRQSVTGEDLFSFHLTFNFSAFDYWSGHMKVMKRVLRPSDVLELLVISANGLQTLRHNHEYLRIRGAFEEVQYLSCYVPLRLGFDLQEWGRANPGLPFLLSIHPAEADAAWLERDIIKRLIWTTTPQTELLIDSWVPPEMRFDGDIRSYRSPLMTESRYDTDISPFSANDDDLARRQHRMNLALDCFRGDFWPNKVRGKAFDMDRSDEEYAEEVENIRFTQEYRNFVDAQHWLIRGADASVFRRTRWALS
jgi:hypothetical protein